MIKKTLLLISALFILSSCKSNLEVISAKKKTVYPGLANQKPYTKFVVEIKAKNPITAKIDSIVLVENNKCYKVDFLLSSKTSSTFLKEVNKSGNYSIEALLKEGKYKELNNCSNAENGKLTIFYKINNENKKLEIDSFTTEKEFKR